MPATISILVKGKEQGVYYRQSTKEKAIELTLTGTVQNQPDGSVLIVVTGDEDNLAQLVEWCKRGPSRANVTEVIFKKLPLTVFKSFSIIR